MAPSQFEGLTVTHALPGRLRVKISRVKQNPELAQQAQQTLGQVPGIHRVEANHLTGSLLILYDLASLASLETLGPLAEVMGELFPEIELESLAGGLQELADNSYTAVTPGVGEIVGTAARHLSPLSGNPSLNLLLPLTLLFLGVRKFLSSREVPLPAWYDYLWFGFSTFVMLNRRWVEGAPATAPQVSPAPLDNDSPYSRMSV
jgi:hypothetical protein